MVLLPSFQSDDLQLNLMQDRWSSILQPILSRPQNKSTILKNVILLAASNPNVVNHLLQANLQGWKIIRQRASAIVWDQQDTNATPQLTLHLRTSADVTIDLEVF